MLTRDLVSGWCKPCREADPAGASRETEPARRRLALMGRVAGTGVLAVIGIHFIVGWLAAAALLGYWFFAFSITATDSGGEAGEKYPIWVLGTLGGLGLVALAGIPAGLSFFCWGIRKILFSVAGLLFLLGVAMVAGVFAWFFRA